MKCYSTRSNAILSFVIAAAVLPVVSSQERYDAVVIGAGWAGLRAVETLLDKGIAKTLVLEATNRVGGRAWSMNSDGTQNDANVLSSVIPYDLGAEFNYDSGINSQQDELWKDDIIPGSVWEDQDDFAVWPTWPGKATYYQQEKNKNSDDNGDDGGQRTATKIPGRDGWMADIWSPFLAFRDDKLEGLAGQSYGETIEQYATQAGITTNDKLQFLNLVRDAKHLEYGTGSYDMDITEIEFTDPTFHVETNYMGAPGIGWGNVAAKYAKQFVEDGTVRMNSKVKEINTKLDPNYAIVTYVDDNGEERTIKARTVLVTVSMGVLKAGNINFVPRLPSYKRASIDAMGFGVINKCIMSWNNQADLVWPNGNEEDRWFLMTTPEDETSGKWTTFSNPSTYKGVPSLTAWIGGQDAIEAEQKTDEENLDDVMTNLKSMFPNIKEPDNVIVTRWGMEEHVLGAYSFPSPGQDYYEDLENIKKRFGKIYFAGEATSSDGWATTFGAWDSGEEVAKVMARKIATLPDIEDVPEAPKPTTVATDPTTPAATTTAVPAPTEPAEITTDPTVPITTTDKPEPNEPETTTKSPPDEALDNGAENPASEAVTATTEELEPSKPTESAGTSDEAAGNDSEDTAEESEPLVPKETTESPPDEALGDDAETPASEPATATTEESEPLIQAEITEPPSSEGSDDDAESTTEQSGGDAEATIEESEPLVQAEITEPPCAEGSDKNTEFTTEESGGAAEAATEESKPSEQTGNIDFPSGEALDNDPEAPATETVTATVGELEVLRPPGTTKPSSAEALEEYEPYVPTETKESLSDEAFPGWPSDPSESTESSDVASDIGDEVFDFPGWPSGSEDSKGSSDDNEEPEPSEPIFAEASDYDGDRTKYASSSTLVYSEAWIIVSGAAFGWTLSALI